MIVATAENVPGHRIDKVLGIVWGTIVRSRHLGHDLLAMLKSIKGGDIRSYENLTDRARADALAKLELNAKSQGADAVIGVRLGTTALMPGMVEVYAYGTAVKLKKA
ncbi:YbjQ family protein [Candidatus Micrarchaeota archaeon]|nr:YbjQ family protein [Candidatus Micrarchaeota archaeon]